MLEIKKIVSILCWLLLIATSLASFGVPEVKKGYISLFIEYRYKSFWLTLSYTDNVADMLYLIPVMINYYIYFGLFILLAVLFVLSCSIIAYNIFKNNPDIDGMFDKISQFHCIPLLCVSAIYIIGEIKYEDENDASLIFNLIFTIIAICSLIFIHIKTEISPRVPNLIIKQATYGCLMALLVYNCFFGIYLFGQKKITDSDDYTPEKLSDFSKNCSIAFSILIGIVSLVISFLIKNCMIPIINFLIYLGMTIQFFNISEKIRKEGLNGVAEGVIEIIMMVLTLAFLSFLFIKYKKQLLGE